MDKTNYIHLSSRKLQPGRISRKCGNTCRILAVGHLFPPPSLVSVPLAPAFPQLGSIPRLWFIRNWFESILTTSSQLLLQWEWPGSHGRWVTVGWCGEPQGCLPPVPSSFLESWHCAGSFCGAFPWSPDDSSTGDCGFSMTLSSCWISEKQVLSM